ncbi:MAG: hypothetical protein U1C19_02380, partial [Methanobacteriaceae archaeon]|nr:hypothetical protein [Methanobacteriaceae archaeon]
LRKEELDFYLYLSNSVLIRFFDVMRHPSDFSKAMHDKREENIYKNPNEMIFYSLLTEKRDDGEINLSWLRGFQIIRNRKSSDIMMAKITNDEEREYASFIILDFKNGLNKEWSSNPAELGNYFEDSDLPFETSPAFFRPEVMSKYSSDPEKYTLNSSSIDCRGAWSIYYNVNDEGQVHAYIKDLSNLPYSEQLYWKSYNEEPKSGISENALKNDFLGEWSTEYDPLGSLKNKISNFPTFTINGESRLLWKMPKLPPTRNIDRLNYVRTESKKEWEDQVSTLYQILVEGLQSKSINALAKKLDCRDGQLKSSKQLIKCLEAIEIKEEDYKKVSEPLTELWILRSEIIAHPGNLNYPNGDLRLHYRNLLERCDIAFKLLQEIIEKELLNS